MVESLVLNCFGTLVQVFVDLDSTFTQSKSSLVFNVFNLQGALELSDLDTEGSHSLDGDVVAF